MALVLSRPGQEVGAGDENANFLKVFSGEVLAAFDQANLFMPVTTVRSIASGKSAVFPALGKAGVNWHTAGESVITDQDAASADYLTNLKSTEKEIFVDDPLLSSVMVSQIDTLKSHWDSRSQYTTAIGRALAIEADTHILSTILAGAATANENVASQTGTGITNTSHTDARLAADLVGFAFDTAQAMDERNVPEDGRYLAVRPKGYYKLAQYVNLLDKDLNSANGGIDAGKVFEVAGLKILKTNSFLAADSDLVADGGAKNDPHAGAGIGYNMDWTTVGACAFQSGGVGTVKLLDLAIESEYQVERQAWLIVAKYVMGHNWLRPESCARMTVTATQF